MNQMKRTLLSVMGVIILFSNMLLAEATSHGIDEAFRIESDGAVLYLKVKGEDISKPVLLFLHGGPGDATGPLFFQAYAGPELEKHFLVGYLHQRFTCQSPEAPLKTLTVRQFVNDVDRMVEFLKEKFNKDKIFLIGHSWGGILGYLYLLEHGDKIIKLASAGSAFSTPALEQNGYRTVLEMAEKRHNQDALEKLKATGPPPYKTLQEGMVWRMLGMNLMAEMNEGPLKNLDWKKVLSITGIKKIEQEWMQKSMLIAGAMWNELSTIDISEKVSEINTPLLAITGAKDIMVPFCIMQKGFANYGGKKEHIIFENSNHYMFVDEPERFVSTVIDFFQK
jgi:proline iminopeptidase